jgi:ubiquinone/menaquinone biosynthesis C-methylase UbiE
MQGSKGQKQQWDETYKSKEFFGSEPSELGVKALEIFKNRGMRKVLELGCGQGRDTWHFLKNGFEVIALDYSETGICYMRDRAKEQGLEQAVVLQVHDARKGIPLPDASMDAVFSHMFFTMEITEREIAYIMKECLRVLRQGGLNIYSVRNLKDPHYGKFTHKGEEMYENPMGFVVHFFDEAKIVRLSEGYVIEGISEFDDTSPPFIKKLYQVTMRKP